MPRQILKTFALPTGAFPPWTIRESEAADMTGWSRRSVRRHMKYFKTYFVQLPGSKRGTRFIDYADFKKYIERFAEDPKVNLSRAEQNKSVGNRQDSTPAISTHQ